MDPLESSFVDALEDASCSRIRRHSYADVRRRDFRVGRHHERHDNVDLEDRQHPAGRPRPGDPDWPGVDPTTTFTASSNVPVAKSWPVPPGGGTWSATIVTIGGKAPPTSGSTAHTGAVHALGKKVEVHWVGSSRHQ
jgi:hypothetical protein